MTKIDTSKLSWDEWDELQNPPPAVTDFDRVVESAISRRGFLGATASTGLVVAFHIPLAGVAAAQNALPFEVNAWVVVKPDDSIVVRIARSEMGQGTMTGLAQRVGEELDGSRLVLRVALKTLWPSKT